MRIALYTAIFGGYNSLSEIPKQSLNADMFCFTDDDQLTTPEWQVIKTDYPRLDLHPRLRAKYFKIQYQYLKELQSYDITIYIDGSVRIIHHDFVKWCVDNLKSDILVFKHPERQCIYQEAKASAGLLKYVDEDIKGQLAEYRKFYPENNGLYALGVLVRKNTALVKKIMNEWWNENLTRTYQDQLSFPVICYLNDFLPSTFRENQYQNDYFHLLWHDDPKKNTMTVLMPVLGTPVDQLEMAVNSILNQTHRDFEFLIVDDNNDDERILGYLKSIADQRLRVVRTRENKGLAAALDFGLSHARNEIIVRMDSDDIARPVLLARHYDFFCRNPHAVCCGVQIQAFQHGNWRSNHRQEITLESAYKSPEYWIVNHPGIAFRKDVVLAVGGYGDTPPHFAEDYPLWIKLLKNGYLIHNHQEVLVNYRLKAQTDHPPEFYRHLEKVKESLLTQ